jgi:AcrR family transcriptional regulator
MQIGFTRVDQTIQSMRRWAMGRRPNIQGRELLLDAALRLFAEQGVEGVSIRAINREAGLGPASVHYHFGTKEALVDAVLHEYGDSVIDRVKDRAKRIAASDVPVDSRAVVAMLAEPYLDLIASHTEEGRNWIRLVSQMLQQDPDRIVGRPSAKLTWSAASRVYPQAPRVQIERAMQMCFIILVTQLAQARNSGRHALDVDLLIDFLSAGLDATLGAGKAGQASA